MNLYFWLFCLYAVLITPLTALLQMRLEDGVHYRIRLCTAGIELFGQKTEELRNGAWFQRAKKMRSIRKIDAPLILWLLKTGELKRALCSFEQIKAEVHAHISFEDAALTAVTYALLRIIVQSAERILPLQAKGNVEMDFRGEGSTFSFQCIAKTRMGKLLASAIRLLLAAAVYRRKKVKMEEKKHAAAPH